VAVGVPEGRRFPLPFPAGDVAVPVGVEHAETIGGGSPRPHGQVLVAGHVVVPVAVHGFEGDGFTTPFTARDLSVVVPVEHPEALLAGRGAGVRAVPAAVDGGVFVTRHHVVVVAVDAAEGRRLAAPLVAGDRAVVVAVELVEVGGAAVRGRQVRI